MKTGKRRNKLMDKETRQMLPVDFFSGMANYAGTADADCGAVYGHWYGQAFWEQVLLPLLGLPVQ